MIYEGPAHLLRWLDGDTAEVRLRVGIPAFSMTIERTHHLRLEGINTPEKRTPEGKDCLAYVASLCPPSPLTQITISGFEKYGRWLGSVKTADGQDVAHKLLAEGRAVKVNYGEEVD